MVGSNFRLGEIESVLPIPQLKKLKNILRIRNDIANSFRNELTDLSGLKNACNTKKQHSFILCLWNAIRP